MDIPDDHPRRQSLVARERIVEGVREGFVAMQGLTAHGRGEAFDYLLGEATAPVTAASIEAAAAAFVLADRPVVSVNGNVAALCPEAVAQLQDASGARVEVNLFHRTPERIEAIASRLEQHGCKDVLGREPDAEIAGLSSHRAKTCSEGIAGADVVLVPLEDGDRCEALVAMGKCVIAIDLNPLSRTAQRASITVVDNVTRALPAITEAVARAHGAELSGLERVVSGFDNEASLASVIAFMSERLARLAQHD